MLSQLRARLARRADSEHGQALVRITLIALILVYTLISAPRWPVSGRQLQQLFCLIAIGQATAVLIFAGLWQAHRARICGGRLGCSPTMA